MKIVITFLGHIVFIISFYPFAAKLSSSHSVPNETKVLNFMAFIKRLSYYYYFFFVSVIISSVRYLLAFSLEITNDDNDVMWKIFNCISVKFQYASAEHFY